MRTFVSGISPGISGLICIALLGCNAAEDDGDSWRDLFNGHDLSNWDTYLGPPYDTTARDFAGDPLGLNNDPHSVFTVVTEDGEPALRISGRDFGGISTHDAFENFHLQLQFKWGARRWPPRDSVKRDNGILYWAVGPHGAGSKFWMRSQELQIQEGDCGDYWGVAGATVDSRAVQRAEEEYVYDRSGVLMTFGGGRKSVSTRLIKGRDGEKPTGTWNTVDLYCSGDTSIHVINGVVAMVLYHSRQPAGDHEESLQKGKIQIQSEGAEVFYRHVRVTGLRQLPKELLR